MPESLAPWDQEPVSAHAPFPCDPGDHYRHEYAEQRRGGGGSR